MKVSPLKYLSKLLVLFVLFILSALLFIGKDNLKTVSAENISSDNEEELPQSDIDNIVLSEMSEKECIEFIVESGVEIPTEFMELSDLGFFVKDVIQKVETTPNYNFDFISYDVTFNFAESIKTVVNRYYNISQEVQSYSMRSATEYTLQDSWVQDSNGDWVSSGGYWSSELFNYYNCYAYAIGRDEKPAEYSTDRQYQPGDFAHTGTFYSAMSIYDLTLIVRDDLEFLGYDVSISSNKPVDLDANEKLICVRKGSQDYHFMRFEPTDGYWYHKPGFTAVLRYKYSPDYKVWTSECSGSLGEYAGSYTYDSDIYYIVYSSPEYTITLDFDFAGGSSETTVCYGEKIVVDYAPYREHYEFAGYYSGQNGTGICYVTGEVQEVNGLYQMRPISTSKRWQTYGDGTLYAYWVRIQENIQYDVISMDEGYLDPQTVNLTSGQQTTLTAPSLDGYTFDHWTINGVMYTTPSVTYTFTLHRSYVTGEITIYHYTGGSATYSDGYMSISFQKNADDGSCVAAGTLITLADGRQIPVETLTGNEMLLVWNLNTGRFDTAPILFIDHDSAAMYKIINLYFSDGTHVKVIDEHAFWDFDLNQYVFLREDAAQYLGHWFNKQTTDENGNLIWTRVQLTNVTISEEYTTAWSPVTYGHLCIYVNGMLSMPGATTGLINIFEVNGDTMQIDQAKYLADIETYGLFTYEEFAAIYPVSEEIFEAFNGQYLKVAIGKGLLDQETLSALIARYAEFFK